jgi:hypothetical protein
MSAALIFSSAPTKLMGTPITGAGWQALSLPTGLPQPNFGGITVMLVALANDGQSAGQTFDVAFNQANSSITSYFPVLSGTTLVTTWSSNIWVQLTESTDTLFSMFAF